MRGGLYYGYPLELGKLKLLPRIGVEYFDSKFVDYYYGVRRDEARSGRPAYEGKATMNLDTGVDLHYSFGDHHTLIAAFKYRAFGAEIKDSPLIDASGSPRANIGYVYRF